MTEGFFASDKDASQFISDVDQLYQDPTNRRLTWRHGIDGAITQREIRVTEIRNWIELKVKPTRSARGRGRPIEVKPV